MRPTLGTQRGIGLGLVVVGVVLILTGRAPIGGALVAVGVVLTARTSR